MQIDGLLLLVVTMACASTGSSEISCYFDTTPFDEGSVLEPQSVSQLDMVAYSGRWYQMYASMIPNKTFEENGYCITADYSFLRSTPHAFYVRNTMSSKPPSGHVKSIRGLAIKRTSVQGQQGLFQLLMEENENYTKEDAAHDFETCIGNYRVISLGPVSKNTGQYQWAVVATPFKSALFILARDVQNFRTEYAQKVLNLVDEMGFNKIINNPRETYQGNDCTYAPEVPVD